MVIYFENKEKEIKKQKEDKKRSEVDPYKKRQEETPQES